MRLLVRAYLWLGSDHQSKRVEQGGRYETYLVSILSRPSAASQLYTSASRACLASNKPVNASSSAISRHIHRVYSVGREASFHIQAMKRNHGHTLAPLQARQEARAQQGCSRFAPHSSERAEQHLTGSGDVRSPSHSNKPNSYLRPPDQVTFAPVSLDSSSCSGLQNNASRPHKGSDFVPADPNEWIGPLERRAMHKRAPQALVSPM